MPTEPAKVRVNVIPQGYDVIVRAGLSDQISDVLKTVTPSRRVAIVCDAGITATHGARVVASLTRGGFETTIVSLPGGENNKTLPALLPAFDALLRWKIERSTPIIALGGGLIGDMTGYLAASILRGVPFIQMPTTLLAMVDASVGGKTGVNHEVGKNLIGAFHQPILVLIDPEFLRSLPDREFRSGLAECIKHDLIRDESGFKALQNALPEILRLDMTALTRLIAHNVEIKASVVAADPFENGERAHLNFGHTFGHAIENVSAYAYTHGECVALGMCAAGYLSKSLGLLSEAAYAGILRVIQAAGLPVRGLTLDTQQLIDAMSFDKKIRSGRLRFVLLDGIGRAVIRDDVPVDLVRNSLDSLRG